MKVINLCCPCVNKSELSKCDEGYICLQKDCPHSKVRYAFPVNNDVPILISETQTDTVCSLEIGKEYVDRSFSGLSILKKLLIGESKVTKQNCIAFVDLVTNSAKRSKVLVIGGGEQGSGVSTLWESENIEIITFDIYASNKTDIVCDAHYIPIKDNSFDGVWVQAVLEHVVEPSKVVSEIYRVLKKEGIVYAETPFMQQVHEGAYDFTRYTVLGHRYLFKDFEMIKIGGNKGPELVLVWALRYFVWSLIRSRKLARIVGLSFGLLMRPFAMMTSNKSMYDASSGVFFLGKKAKLKSPISHKDLISLYKGQF
jgi:SAM-dependent methyltransferase